jgi:hypothetical protein
LRFCDMPKTEVIISVRKRGHPLKGPLSRDGLPRYKKMYFLAKDNVRRFRSLRDS